MVWSVTLPDEIIPVEEYLIPSNGLQVPGSGTIYIGPNLPAELVARGITRAIVWWTHNPTYKYYYQALDEPFNNDDYLAMGSVALDGTFGPEILIGPGNTPFAVIVSGLKTTLYNNGLRSLISDGTNIDQWVHRNTNITQPGVYTINLVDSYKITYDRVVDYRAACQTIAGAFTSLQFVPWTLPGPIIPPSPQGLTQIMIGAISRIAGGAYFPIPAYLEGAAVTFQQVGNPNGINRLLVSGTWTLDKV